MIRQQQHDLAPSEQQPKPIYNTGGYQQAQSTQGQILLSPVPSAATLRGKGGYRRDRADWIQEQPGAPLPITQGQMLYLPQQQNVMGTCCTSFVRQLQQAPQHPPCPCMLYGKHRLLQQEQLAPPVHIKSLLLPSLATLQALMERMKVLQQTWSPLMALCCSQIQESVCECNQGCPSLAADG